MASDRPQAAAPAAGAGDPWQRVAAVTVTHHSAAVIGACLSRLGAGAEVIVVDNASDDASREIAHGARPDARLIHNRVGLGYGNGINCGLRLAHREFVLMINPDAMLMPEALTRLVAAADRYPSAAILAPLMLAPDGHAVASHDVGLLARSGRPRKRLDAECSGDLCADYLSGAAMLVRRRALDEVGGFDPNIFLYYEDDDLCLRLRRKGWSLVLVADAKVEHIGGGSVRAGWPALWEKFWHMAWSRLYLERKYRGTGAMLGVAAPLLVRYSGKAFLYLVAFNRMKLVRDAARFCGTAGYLLGIPAMPKAPLP